MSKFARSSLTAAAALAALVFTATPALADIAIIDLTDNNLPAPPDGTLIGTVTVNRTSSTTATFTFSASSGYRFTDGGAAAVNTNGATTASAFVIPSTLAQQSAGNEDGFGSFNTRFTVGASFPDSTTFIEFTLTLNSGTWASVSDVLTANSGGNLAAAHFGICNTGCTAFLTNNGTGFVAGTEEHFPSTSTIPEPNSSSLALLALGLLGAGFWTRRKA